MIKFLAVLGLLNLAKSHPALYQEPENQNGVCGYDSCPAQKPGMINVHLVPHTHDDVGWLKTVDQYYFGSKTHIQNAGVQYIIDSVVSELLADPKKKFIYVETSFFWKWWNEQDDKTKHLVKGLVKRGQLEFIGGGWSMNDEATAHYQSILDQFTWGFRKLNDTFGSCGRPKIGWQIDPFGHSREMASMMAQFGFDGLFFGRLDYQDKMERMEKRTMEMIWEGDPTLGPKADIFTGTLYNLYQAPRGFCFDIMCGDEPIIDDINSPDYNVIRRVNKFLDYIVEQGAQYKSTQIMLTMGGDFNYLDAHYYFKNLEKLIRYVNDRQSKGSNVNVFYSTPSCYVKSLHDANLTWPTKQDDFFPYASDPHAYWTGYFTSRPTLKYFERQGNNHLQTCKQLAVLAQLQPEKVNKIDALREAMGVMQHHDAITGTEKQQVANDYARILSAAIEKCDDVTSAALSKIMTRNNTNVPSLNFSSCPLSNISECSVSGNSNKFLATVYNPLSRPVDYIVRLPVKGYSYNVEKAGGTKVESQVVPVPEPVLNLPGRKSETTMELLFKAEAVPPLGYSTYFITLHSSDLYPPEKENFDEEISLSFSTTHVKVNATTGQMIRVNIDGIDIPLHQELKYYEAAAGSNNHFDNRASGAYIFRPKGNHSIVISNGKPNFTMYKGPIVNEVQITFSDWASQVIRHYVNSSYVELEWLVGPIPIEDGHGKEVVSEYHTNIDNKGVFYTDSNGRQTLERKRNSRATWNLKLEEPVAGNYYPITTDISISNGDIEFTVITDRAQGGSSLEDGQIELMLHRRLLHDDGFGVGEALNEMAFDKGLVARGRHWMIAGRKSNPEWAMKKRLLQQEKVLSPQVTLTDLSEKYFSTEYYHPLMYSGLRVALPPEVHLLTLEPWKDNTYLIRLEHILDKTETNSTVTVDLERLFADFSVRSVRETALGADRFLEEVSRFQWKKETNEIFEDNGARMSAEKTLETIILEPKQIRTFICELVPN